MYREKGGDSSVSGQLTLDQVGMEPPPRIYLSTCDWTSLLIQIILNFVMPFRDLMESDSMFADLEDEQSLEVPV
jgi:hypothetical protein